MEINIILTFFESNVYLFLLIMPFFSQLGIPLGTMFFIIFAGAVTNNLSELFILFFIVLISTISGDILAYFIGKKLSHLKFFQFLLNIKSIKYLYKKSEKFFDKRGEISIFLSRFLVTGVGPTISYLVGIQKFSFKKFLLNVSFGEILYAAELLILGYIFKDSFEDVFNIIYNFGFVLLLTFLLYKIGKKLFKKIGD